MSENQVNLHLKEDVENFVNNKIRDVKYVDEITNCFIFSIERPEYKNEIKTRKKLSLLKKLLQLTINAYNNFEIYRDYTVKFVDNGKDIMKPLGNFYKYNSSNEVWTCFRKPNKAYVEDILFNYIVCFKSVEMTEESIANSAVRETINVSKCPFCEGEILSGDDSCSACSTSMPDIVDFLLKLRATKKEVEYRSEMIKENDSTREIIHGVKSTHEVIKQVESPRLDNVTDSDSDCDKEIRINQKKVYKNSLPRYRESNTVNNCHTCVKCQNAYRMSVDESLSKSEMNWICSECRMKDDSDNTWTDIVTEHVYDVDDENWNCGDCGARNDNGVNVCGGCGIERLGRGSKESGWSCVRCSAKNDIEASVCYVCDRERLERGTKEGGWRCALCKTLYPYDKSDCPICCCSMEDGGRWVCQSCTFENKFVDLTCEACSTDNANVVIKYCQLCKQKRIDLSQKLCGECIYENNLHSATDWWQCKYKDCGIWNDNGQDYCSNCRLSRHNDYNTRGAPCNRWKNGKNYAVWMCSSCNTCNDIKATRCGSWTCWATRFGKKVCGACKTQNNGTTNFCSNCTTLL